MELRLNFYGNIPDAEKTKVEKSYNDHISTFSTYAKIFRSTLFYVDRIHRKVYFASHNLEITDYNFEKETDVDFWIDRMSEECVEKLSTINQAIVEYSANEAKIYGWDFSISFTITMLLNNEPLNLLLLGVPVEVAEDKLISILYIVSKSDGENDDGLEIFYKNGPSLRFNFADGRFYEKEAPPFSSEELSIVRLSGLGLNEEQIAIELEIPMHEIKRIKYNLFLKLRVKNMPHALFTLHRLGYIR